MLDFCFRYLDSMDLTDADTSGHSLFIRRLISLNICKFNIGDLLSSDLNKPKGYNPEELNFHLSVAVMFHSLTKVGIGRETNLIH